ncbi:hypothetical protein [Azotobacter chroococcum]|uniref:hypothetical protein n=1 Tax=Azotobacter chroococcum TaxID=353 RepID=UPI001EF05EEB|nr:hypothetical protein [Azotobacter chroococcum]
MKNFGAPALALTLSLLTFGSPHAAEASREIEEQTTGKSPGGMNGMMIGAGIGALFGGEAQEASGLGERNYEADGVDGERKALRAPN